MTLADWKPRIYRSWDARAGRFEWACTDPPYGWTGPNQLHLLMTGRAIRFCATLNSTQAS